LPHKVWHFCQVGPHHIAKLPSYKTNQWPVQINNMHYDVITSSLVFSCIHTFVTYLLRPALINREGKCAENYNNDTIIFFWNRNQRFGNFKPYNSFWVLFDKIVSVYFIWKYILIFYHWKSPAQGTGIVPVVSAHFRSRDRDWDPGPTPNHWKQDWDQIKTNILALRPAETGLWALCQSRETKIVALRRSLTLGPGAWFTKYLTTILRLS